MLVDVVLLDHVIRVNSALGLGGKAVLVDVGRVLSHVLRVEEHRLVNWIHLGFELVTVLQFRVEISESLLHSQLRLVAQERLQGSSWWLFHAASVVGDAVRVLIAHLRVRLLR